MEEPLLSVLESLGVPELLCNSVTLVSIQEIAQRTACHTDEKIYKVLRTMAQWGIGEELSEKHFKANRAMELLRRDKGPSLGHMVGYYASDEVWAAMLAFPQAVKDDGDTAFELAHGMNLYDYMYRAEELEYSAPTKSEDRWSWTARSQLCLQRTPRSSAIESWTLGEERVSFYLRFLNCQTVNILKEY